MKIIKRYVLHCFCLTAAAQSPSTDSDLIKRLLHEDLDKRTFAFTDVVLASAEKKVIPLDDTNPAHKRITSAIHAALTKSIAELSSENSPVRKLRRINEASKFFEDSILTNLNNTPGIRCEFPNTKEGHAQRSGYPDLKITDTASGTIAYLDPKLVEKNSLHSTLRTFYYEPKTKTLKINHDAIHLLCGIEHDGKDGAWTFLKHHLVDLSKLRVRLKAEFQASNEELYQQKK